MNTGFGLLIISLMSSCMILKISSGLYTDNSPGTCSKMRAVRGCKDSIHAGTLLPEDSILLLQSPGPPGSGLLGIFSSLQQDPKYLNDQARIRGN